MPALNSTHSISISQQRTIFKRKSTGLIFGKQQEPEPEQPNMPLLSSVHFTSMWDQDQVNNVFKELKEIHDKFLTLLIALVAATNTDPGNSLLTKHYKLMMSLILAIVLYSFLATVGAVLQIHNTNLIPIIRCAMLMLGSAVSVMALCFISTTVAWITLPVWLGMFTLVVYDYGVPNKIKNWIKGQITRS